MRESLPFSQEPWVDRLCADALDHVTPLLESRLAPYRLKGIVLGGSASLGEAVGWDDPHDRFVLSDLDLGIVTDLPVPASERVSLAEEARAAVDPAGPEPTLGFYETRFLGSQAPTLGLVDLRGRGRVLVGEADLLRRFAGPDPGQIPAWEALRLLGNRALELLRAPVPDEETRDRARAWFAAAKLATAPWTARLVSQGRYRIGWRERAALLHDTEPGGPHRGGRVLGTGGATVGPSVEVRRDEDAVVVTARLWAPFLEQPRPDSAPPRGAVLPSLRAGLVGFFREAGYWPDAPGVGCRVAAAYLAEPVSLRERLRAWRRAGAGWAARSRMRGTPEGRRLGASVLYWLCAMESPEPYWGDWAGEVETARWDRESAGLLARPVPGGPGGRQRLLAELTGESG